MKLCNILIVYVSSIMMARALSPLSKSSSYKHKYLGGAITADHKSIYAMPSHSNFILKISVNVSSPPTISYLSSPPAINGKFSFLRSVTIPGKHQIVGIPCWADYILSLDTKTDEITQSTFPAEQQNWAFHGGQYICSHVYCVPCNADRVMKFCPETLRATFIGPTIPTKNSYYGGILGGIFEQDAMYCIPFGESNETSTVLKVVGGSDEVTFLPLKKNLPRFAFHGAVASRGIVYGIPSHANQILKIDTTKNDKIDLIELPELKRNLKYQYGGGCVDLGGNVWMMPSDGDHVLRLDVESGELKTFETNHLLGKNVHKNKFQGGVVTPWNVIYAIPANANHVLRIDASSNSVSVLSTEISGSRRCKFQGAFFSSIDEACYFLPEHSDSILRISKNEDVEFISLPS